MWNQCISFIEHLVSLEMKKKVFKCQKVSLIRISLTFHWRFLFCQLANKITIDFSFTSIILFQPEKQAINKIYSFSGCPKSLQENNKTFDKSVLPGSLTWRLKKQFFYRFCEINFSLKLSESHIHSLSRREI